MRRRSKGEGGIYRRSDGRWCASVDLGHSNGKRRRRVIYAKTRREVAEKLFELHPELQKLHSAMFKHPCRGVRMSGSGGAIYAIHDSRDQAEKMKAALDKGPLDVQTHVLQAVRSTFGK